MMTTFDTSTPAALSTGSTASTALQNHHQHHFVDHHNSHSNNNHFSPELMLTAAAAAAAASSTVGGRVQANSSQSQVHTTMSSQSASTTSSTNSVSVCSSNSPSNLSSCNDDSGVLSLTSLNNNGVTNNNVNNNNNQYQVHTPDPAHFMRILQECRTRLASKQKYFEKVSNRLHGQYQKAQQEIGNAYQLTLNALEKSKNDQMKELEDVYNARIISVTILTSKIEEHLRKIENFLCYIDRNGQQDCTSESMINCKSFIDSKLQTLLNIDPDSSFHSNDLEFVINYQSIQSLVKNIGFIRSSPESNNNNNNHNHSGHHNNGKFQRSNSNFNSASMNGYDHSGGLVDRFGSFGLNCGNNRSMSSSISDSLNAFNYDKWSAVGNMNGNCLTSGSNSSPDSTMFNAWTNAVPVDGMTDLSLTDPIDLMTESPLSSSVTPVMPIKSQVQRQKMIYHCKFGEFGIMEGQFTEPSGVAVNAQNDIIVADTNNHRIQIFDKDGRFKFQFGECGKRDGQLLYPNRVAVVKQSGDIIVTERSPTHQIQVYNQYGQFVRKFGADILQHPRGVTVDYKGNIIIVECKVMRVIIFDLMGNVLHKFGCSKHLEFPNGVVVNDKQEIFISDNRAHCVKVFSYSGTFLRNIGGEGLTNYPIGVCINDNGEILVADNHNNFNITIFTQDGTLVNALESKVKHSQCFDVALMDDNSVVLASKDYRIYIYRYLQLQSLATAVATSGIC